MSSQKAAQHSTSPLPWHSKHDKIYDGENNLLADFMADDEAAARAVACVNRLEGFPTDQIEDEGIDLFGTSEAMHTITRLKKQRDALLAALKRVMSIDAPLTGNPTHEELVEFWEYEKSQGRGEADDRLLALAAIAAAGGAPDSKPSPYTAAIRAAAASTNQHQHAWRFDAASSGRSTARCDCGETMEAACDGERIIIDISHLAGGA